jgi:uncharacterized membrane protein
MGGQYGRISGEQEGTMLSVLVLVVLGVGLLLLLFAAVAIRLVIELAVRAVGTTGSLRAVQTRETFMIEEWRHNGGGSNPVIVLGTQDRHAQHW